MVKEAGIANTTRDKPDGDLVHGDYTIMSEQHSSDDIAQTKKTHLSYTRNYPRMTESVLRR